MSERKNLRHRLVGRKRGFCQETQRATCGKEMFHTQGNVCSLPYEDGTFDAVTAFETVYFWSPIKTALAEVARVLRKGGCFLISLEASDPDMGEMWTKRITGMTVYTADDLKRLLAEAGFSSVKTIHEKEELHIIAHK